MSESIAGKKKKKKHHKHKKHKHSHKSSKKTPTESKHKHRHSDKKEVNNMELDELEQQKALIQAKLAKVEAAVHQSLVSAEYGSSDEASPARIAITIPNVDGDSSGRTISLESKRKDVLPKSEKEGDKGDSRRKVVIHKDPRSSKDARDQAYNSSKRKSHDDKLTQKRWGLKV